MDITTPHTSRLARWLLPVLLGWVAGTAWQLQQAALFAWPVYAWLMLLAPVLMGLGALKYMAHKAPWRLLLAALASGVLAFALTGLRASAFASNALDTELEGQDVALTGVIAAMPQYNEAGLRFRLEVESAQWQGQPISLPPSLDLSWYAGVLGGGAPGQTAF